VANRGNSTFIYVTVPQGDGMTIQRLNPSNGLTLSSGFNFIQTTLIGRPIDADIDANGNLVFSNSNGYQKFNQSLAPVWSIPNNFLVFCQSIRVHPQQGQVVAFNFDGITGLFFLQFSDLNPASGAVLASKTISIPESEVTGATTTGVFPRPNGGWIAAFGGTFTGMDRDLKINSATRTVSTQNFAIDASGQVHVVAADRFRVINYPRGNQFDAVFGSGQRSVDVAVDSQGRVVIVGSGNGNRDGAVLQAQTPFLAATDVFFERFEGLLTIQAPGVLVNDINSAGGVLSLETAPTKGTVTLRPDGSFDYRPNAGTDGNDQFRYRLTKGVTSRTATAFIRRLIPTELRVFNPEEIGGDFYGATIVLSSGAFVEPFSLPITSSNPTLANNFTIFVDPSVATASGIAKTGIVTASTSVTLSATLSGRTVTRSFNLLPGALTDIVSTGNLPLIRGEQASLDLILSGPAGYAHTYRVSPQSSPNATASVAQGALKSTVTVSLPDRSSVFIRADRIRNGRRTEREKLFNLLPPPVPASGRSTFSPVYAGVQNRFEVTLTGAAGLTPVSVGLASSRTDVPIASSMTIQSGQNKASVAFTPNLTAANQNTTITATRGTTSVATTFLVRPNLLESLTVSPNVVRAGNGAIGTVSLNWLAPSPGQTVKLRSNKTTVATVPETVFFSTGSTVRNFPVATKKPQVATSTVTITATLGKVSKSTTLNVTP